MASGPVSLILKKSLAENGEQPAKVMAVQEVLSVAIPRDAGKLLNLHAEVVSFHVTTTSEEAILQSLADENLMFFLRANNQSPGLCVVTAPIISALIDVQIMGQVSGAIGRIPTATDAAIISEMLDQWLESAERECATVGLVFGLEGYQRAKEIVSLRECELDLETGNYQAMTVTVSLAEGAVEGAIHLYLPERREQKKHNVAQQMRRHVDAVRAPLSAVLVREPVSFDRIQRISEGDLFDFPLSALNNVVLETEDGGVMAEGRLGQMNGSRAVRVNLAKDSPLSKSLQVEKTAPSANVSEFSAEQTSESAPNTQPDQPIEEQSLPELPDLPELPELPELPAL